MTQLIRGLGAVAHDAVHGTVFKSKMASYWFGLLCWAPTGMAYTIYSNYHLHHHRITNTYPDVDNFVVTDYTKNPFLAKVLLVAIYSFAYPIYFLFNMFRYTQRLTFWKKVRMNLEVIGWWSLVVYVAHVLPSSVFFFIYGVPFILGTVLASTTSMIEHFQMEPGEDAYSSRTYGTKMYVNELPLETTSASTTSTTSTPASPGTTCGASTKRPTRTTTSACRRSATRTSTVSSGSSGAARSTSTSRSSKRSTRTSTEKKSARSTCSSLESRP